ncbi:MAG TPA: hydrogenase [Gammaproteobacteria bacterium]|nr:hydrogenase [Gammaproteobacteria bacterium]
MFSPLVQNMIERYGYPVLGDASLDDFLEAGGDAVLFFTEDAARFPETNDVAMILPELVRAFDGRFTAAVPALADQRRLQMRFGFREWPTLVFLRNGEYLGAISRVQDWNVYLAETRRILAAAPSMPPDFMLPVAGAECCP